MPDLSRMKKPDVKLVFLGDMNVGKTSLLHRYMERKFKDTISTVGGAFFLKQWGPYNISIWDTAGNTSACFLTWLVCVFFIVKVYLRRHAVRHPRQSAACDRSVVTARRPSSWEPWPGSFSPCLLGTTRAAHVKPGTIQSFQVRQEENNPIIQHNEVQPVRHQLSLTNKNKD